MRRAFVVMLQITMVGLSGPVNAATLLPAPANAIDAPFLRDAAAGWRLRRDADSGVPTAIFGGRSAALEGWRSDEVAATRRFFHENAALFRLRSGIDSLEVERLDADHGLERLRVTQRYRGITVFGGEYLLSAEPDGRLRMISGRFFPGIDCATRPGASVTAALARSRDALPGFSPVASRGDPRVVYGRARGSVLAYAIELERAGEGLTATAYLDANSLEILEVVRHFTQFTGSGNMYPDDARDPGAFVLSPLPRLSGGSSLAGPLEVIHDGGGADAVGDSGRFIYPAGDPRLVQTNAYWHVDHFFNDFIGPLGHLHPYTIGVTVNEPPSFNSPSLAQPNALTFEAADGTAWNNAALVSDVIDHECGHIVLYDYGLLPSQETAALHEGVADYFAAAVTDDPVLAEWFLPECDAGLRDIASDPAVYRYGNYDHVSSGCGGGVGDPHSNGMILSGALWDLRGSLGPVTDAILVEALSYVSSHATFADLAAAMLQADVDHHSAAHMTALEAGFQGRQIRIADAGARVAIQGPTDLGRGQSATYSTIVVGGFPPYSYHWIKRSRLSPDSTEDRFVGSGSTVIALAEVDFELVLEVTDALGVSNTATRSVTVDPGATVSIEGPDDLARAQSATYRALSSGGRPPYRLRWIEGRRVSADSTVLRPLGVDSTITVRDTVGFIVELDVADALGVITTARETVSVRAYDQLPAAAAIRIAGEAEVRPDAPARYSVDLAAWSGEGPFDFSWARHELDCDGSEAVGLPMNATSTPTASTVLVTPGGADFILTVHAADRYTRVTAGRMDVHTFHACESPLLRVDAIATGSSPLRITFSLDARSPVVLGVFDVAGRLVARPFEGQAEVGLHVVWWDATRATNGVYFLRLLTPGRSAVRRVVLRH